MASPENPEGTPAGSSPVKNTTSLERNQVDRDETPVVREMIKYSNDILNHRLTWLGTFQGLLLAALAFAWKDAHQIVFVLCPLGFLVAASIGIGTYRANQAIEDLERKYERLSNPSASEIATIGLRSRTGFTWMFMPGYFIPWLFAGAWLLITLMTLFHGDSVPRVNL